MTGRLGDRQDQRFSRRIVAEAAKIREDWSDFKETRLRLLLESNSRSCADPLGNGASAAAVQPVQIGEHLNLRGTTSPQQEGGSLR